MTSVIIPVDPFDFVIFGATGDLSERKLLPALYHRQKDGQFSEPTRIIGASRSVLDHEAYRNFAREALRTHLKEDHFEENDKYMKYMPPVKRMWTSKHLSNN